MNLTLNTKRKKKKDHWLGFVEPVIYIYIYLIPELSNKHPFRVLIHVISSAGAYIPPLLISPVLHLTNYFTQTPQHTYTYTPVIRRHKYLKTTTVFLSLFCS